MQSNKLVLCAASAYEEKFYLNEAFNGLPEGVKEDLKIISVLFTADVGGVLIMEFNEDGELELRVDVAEDDLLFDEIGSALKIKQIQRERWELFEALEMYYRVFILGDASEIDA